MHSANMAKLSKLKSFNAGEVATQGVDLFGSQCYHALLNIVNVIVESS